MSTVLEIKHEIENLSANDLMKFRAWFEKFDADAWDKQFESDVKVGELDSLAQQALNDFKKN